MSDTHDKKGREWAKYSELNPGDEIVTDGEIPCLEDKVHMVYGERSKLYVHCEEGNHYLKGQLGNDDEHLIGIYKVED